MDNTQDKKIIFQVFHLSKSPMVKSTIRTNSFVTFINENKDKINQKSDNYFTVVNIHKTPINFHHKTKNKNKTKKYQDQHYLNDKSSKRISYKSTQQHNNKQNKKQKKRKKCQH